MIIPRLAVVAASTFMFAKNRAPLCRGKSVKLSPLEIVENVLVTALLSAAPIPCLTISALTGAYNFFNVRNKIRKIFRPLNGDITVTSLDNPLSKNTTIPPTPSQSIIKCGHKTIALLKSIQPQKTERTEKTEKTEKTNRHIIFNFGGIQYNKFKGISDKNFNFQFSKKDVSVDMITIDPTYQDCLPEMLIDFFNKEDSNTTFSAVGTSAGCVGVDLVQKACFKLEAKPGEFIVTAPVINPSFFPDASHWLIAPLARAIVPLFSLGGYQQSVLTKENGKEYPDKTTVIYDQCDQLGQSRATHEANLKRVYEKVPEYKFHALRSDSTDKHKYIPKADKTHMIMKDTFENLFKEKDTQ